MVHGLLLARADADCHDADRTQYVQQKQGGDEGETCGAPRLPRSR
jgi:hypothetical protein